MVPEVACGLDPEVGFAVESPVDDPEVVSFVPNKATCEAPISILRVILFKFLVFFFRFLFYRGRNFLFTKKRD